MKNNKSISILVLSLLFLFRCSLDGVQPHFSKYYEENFTDSISVFIPSDSLIIIIEQFAFSGSDNKDISHTILNTSVIDDTIKLLLNVNYGSYSSNPSPFKDVYISNDTLRIWYASIEREELYLFNKSSLTPLEEYFDIENVIIKKSPMKWIYFESKLYY